MSHVLLGGMVNVSWISMVHWRIEHKAAGHAGLVLCILTIAEGKECWMGPASLAVCPPVSARLLEPCIAMVEQRKGLGWT